MGGGAEPLPPFFRIGLFSFPKMDGSLRRHSTLSEMGGFPPLEEKASEDENSSSNALATHFQFLASRIPNRIGRRDDDPSS